MIAIWIILSFLLLLFVLSRLMLNGFRNPQRKHTKTPSELGINFEEARFKTLNNRLLYGWWTFKNESYPSIILVHGWGRNVGRMLPYIENFNKQQYNILAFDTRHHGSSDKDKLSTMRKFAEDITSAIDFIDQRTANGDQKIGIVGLSIGGAAAIYASAHDKRINSIITVGAFANPFDVMKLQLSKRYIPYYPIGWLLLKYLEYLVGFKFNDIAPEKHINQTDANIMLIHGVIDQTIPVSHAERLKNKAKIKNVKLWKIENRGHSDCHKEEDYWDRINQFFKESLN